MFGVIFAYALGALVGWQMFTSAAREQWHDQAQMNIQIASASLRNIYSYIAVDVDHTGQVNRIVSDIPIGDDDSVLYTGFSPDDVLALITAQTKNDAWIFSYDQSAGAFKRVAGTTQVVEGDPDILPSATPLFSEAGSNGQLATGLTTIGGERYYAGLLPIVRSDGTLVGGVLVSVGRETDLNRMQIALARNSLIVMLILLVFTSIGCTIIANRLFKPVPALIRATLRIANDQTDMKIPFQNRTDEIGDLAVAIETLRGAVVERSHLRDIRDMAVELAHMAHHDPLTGLPNRALLMKTLEEAVSGLHSGQRFNVLMLDLDRFKSINDTMGHASGDTLLMATADRLVGVLGPGDVVARLGGDEFAIIQKVARNPALEAHLLAERLLKVVSSRLVLNGLELVIGTSIGIACAPEHGIESTQLLKNADLALYRAKASGRGLFSFFHDGMDMAVQDQHALELDLRLALQRREFELHYQPIINLGTMQTCGFEALVRWRHPQRGMVPPDQFIGLAEETGMIVPLGEWILSRACRDAATWPTCFKLSVNLSAAQLQQSGLIGAVERALGDAGLGAERLELEVTETVLLAGAESIATLETLKRRGVGIVLDDFGTGYASLSNLVTLPFSKIKIDRSFVANLTHQNNCRAIVGAITGLARSLDMDVTAEGVETAEQLAILRAAGCTNVQGFYFSKPLPLDQIDLSKTSSHDDAHVRLQIKDAS